MNAKPIEIAWHSGMPVFASEPFLKSVGDHYGWLGGFDDAGTLRCILPFTIMQKSILRLVRFRVETMPFEGELSLSDERSFLNSTVDLFRTTGADIIIPASNNTIFRTYPDGADAAPYGSYVIDLSQPTEILWQNIHHKVRQNINTAIKNGVTVRDDPVHLELAYRLIHDTFKRSRLRFMNYRSFDKFVQGLGNNCRVMMADHQGVPQSCIVFAFSRYSAYAVYGGNVPRQQQGSIKLLCWEAICSFKKLGIQRFDFFGSRVMPEEGSKQADLCDFKRRFGAELKTGFMWKYPLSRKKFILYTLLRQLWSGGDIVDAERHKLDRIVPEISTRLIQADQDACVEKV